MKNLIVFLSLVLVFGCGVRNQAPQVLVMIDFSISVRGDQGDYERYMHTILNQMPPNSRLVVGKIVQSTEASFSPFIDVRFPDDNYWTTNPDDVAEMKDSLLKLVTNTCDSVFRNTQLSPWTDIISALGLVHQVFRSRQNRVIVFLSDMLQSSTDFDLEKDNITEHYIEKTIARLEHQGRLPDLHGVKVYIAGARANSEDRFIAVRRFWQRVFQETGAELESYSHTLMNFHLEPK